METWIEAPYLSLVIGICLILLGRKLYWFFIGLAGFFFAYQYIPDLLPALPDKTSLLISLAAGGISAALGVFLNKLFIFAGGFIAGAYLFLNVVQFANLEIEGLVLVGIAVGGLVGSLLLAMVMEWGLVVLTAAIGALLVLQTLPVNRQVMIGLFILMMILGLVAQASMMKPFKLSRT